MASGPAGALGATATWVLAACSAAAFVLAFPPVSLWWLAPVSAACLAKAAIGARSLRGVLAAVATCWTAAWGALEWWIVEVSVAGFPALVAYLVAWSLAHALVLRIAARSALGRRLPLALLLPVTWVGVEFLRASVLFDGYPWYLLGHPLAEEPVLIQSADLLGVPLVSAAVAMVAGALVDLLGRRVATAKTRWSVAVATLVAIASLLGYGAHRLNETDELASARASGVAPGVAPGVAVDGEVRQGPLVLAIQTNLPQSNKIAWSPQRQVDDFDAFRRLTMQAFGAVLDEGRIPDIVAWPETMLPGFGLEPETIQTLVGGGWFPGALFAEGIADLVDALRRPMLVGSASFEGLRADGSRFAWDRHFNSAYALAPDGRRQRYDKVFLTPFGETMPYISAWPWLEQRLLDIGASGMRFDLEVGESLAPLRLESPSGAWAVATPICFEDTVSAVCRRMVFGPVPADGTGGSAAPGAWGKRADLFVNLSNDGWFGTSDAGRMQHAQIARFRCVECRVPMVRCVNTGLSVAIDSAGRLRGAAVGEGYGQARTEGWLATPVILDPRVPVYAHLGDALGWCAAAATGLLLLLPGRRPSAGGPRLASESRVAMQPARRRNTEPLP